MKKLLLCSLLLLCPSLQASEWSPDYMVSQTGGYVGLISVGAGYEPYEEYRFEAILGFTPEKIAGIRDIWSIMLKNTVQSSSLSLAERISSRGYIGFAGIFLLDSNDSHFIRLPAKYPRKYYPSTAFRTAPYIGVEVEIDSNTVLYSELTALDHYLETYIRSDGELDWTEISTYSIGYRRDL